MKLGDLNATDKLFAELLINTPINQTIATNGNATYTVGTFQMPMAGTCIAQCRVNCTWTVANIQQVTVVPTPSTPAPNVAYGSVQVENGLTGGQMIQVNHALAQWTGLAALATVTIKVNVAVSIFAPTVTVSSASALVRAHRA